MKNASKYERAYFMPPVCTYDWVKKDTISVPPIWCSVDLRDGNQALIEPMSLDEKLQFFKMLVDIGFKEIEVGFPAASETEYEFMRALIERNMIPNDVTVQVLTQAREHIIRKTFEALKGAKNAIVHVYNSTSLAQREQVFHKSKEEILEIAVEGAKLLNINKEPFMEKYHPKAELAPRDVVARAIFNEMEKTNARNVYLDITSIGLDRFKTRFPAITNICNEANIDLATGLIPVSPAAHYFMGGVKVNSNMETTIENLYAIGEVSRTGLHGANRLASNSLLECVVCAYKLADTLSQRNLDAPKSFDTKIKSTLEMYDSNLANDILETGILRRMLKKAMWQNAGIVRTQSGLNNALRVIDDITLISRNLRVYSTKDGYELRNSIIAAKLIVEAALRRENSIGAHYREDMPELPKALVENSGTSALKL